MVELLVVIFILAILVALIASVSTYVLGAAGQKETAAIQAIVMEAIAEYQEAKGEAPSPDSDDGGDGSITELLQGKGGDKKGLQNFRGSQQKLLELPENAYKSSEATEIFDAWDQAMRYDADGGFGGTPVVISAGPDGNFDNTEDNIRSDGR